MDYNKALKFTELAKSKGYSDSEISSELKSKGYDINKLQEAYAKQYKPASEEGGAIFNVIGPFVILFICVLIIWYYKKTTKILVLDDIINFFVNSSKSQKEAFQEPKEGPKKTYTVKEINTLYKRVVKKYHPDFAKNDNDKVFRTKLTAKINKAYESKDFETLKMFDIDE